MLCVMISVCETFIIRCVCFYLHLLLVTFQRKRGGYTHHMAPVVNLVHVVECNIFTNGVLDGGIGWGAERVHRA